MLCINCGQEVNTQYCTNCGQKHPPKKITLTSLWSDFFARIYGFDGMFPRTLKDLTLKPGFVTLEYIRGNRVKYYGPVGYFFLMVTLYFLIMPLLGFNLDELVNSANGIQIKPGSNQERFVKNYVGFISANIRLFLFFLIVTISFASYLVFKKSKLNLLESSLLPFFTHGHMYWVSILMLVIKSLFDLPLKDTGMPVIQALFFAFGCTSLYKHQTKWKIFLKGILAYLLGSVFLVACVMVVGILFFVRMKFTG